MNSKAAILYFHSIDDYPLSVSVEAFKKQIRWLYERSYSGCCMRDIRNELSSAKEVAITFDDCLESIYENAVPILSQFGFKATFFATVEYVGKTRWGSVKHQRWSDERTGDFNVPFRYMDWDQLKSLVESGMEIGAHMITHCNLTDLSKQEQEKEIAGSKEILEEKLGIEVEAFSYPRGKFDDGIVDIVKAAGYKAACTTAAGYVTEQSDALRLDRFAGGKFNMEFKSVFCPKYRLICDFKNFAKQTLKRMLK